MHLVAIVGSNTGISAGLRARELDPTVAVAYPNISFCGIPCYLSGKGPTTANLGLIRTTTLPHIRW